MRAIGAVLLALLTALPASAACVMSLRLVDDPPYFIVHDGAPPGGVHADVAREALRRIGCTVEFRDQPFPRALKELAEGRLDMMPDLYLTPERQKFALYSRTYSRVPDRLFLRAVDRHRWDVRSYDDLPRLGIRLGVETGVLVSSDFGAVAADPRFHAILTTATSHESLWRMLKAKRIDAVILDELAARWELAHFGLTDEIVGSDFVSSTESSYFAFSRATVSPDQVRRFDAAVAAMHRDGSWAAILAAYGLPADAAIDRIDN